jgi:putative ABC transport system ATP-binding protein
MILARELVKIYGHGSTATQALKGVDLNIQKGEFVAIMGRSGSGKSTLLHLLGMLDKPTSGNIYIDDADVLQLSEKERARFRLEKLGYVFQEYSLIGEMTVMENVYMPSICLNNSSYKKAYARELLDIVGLGHRLNIMQGKFLVVSNSV